MDFNNPIIYAPLIVLYACAVVATIGFMKRVFKDAFLVGPFVVFLPIPWIVMLLIWIYAMASGQDIKAMF